MARSDTRRDRGKEQFWRRLLRLQANSGLTIRAFCFQHDVSEASFFAWRRTIAQRDRRTSRPAKLNSETAGSVHAPVPAESGVDGQPLFVPLRVVSTCPASGGQAAAFEVVLSSGRIVRVPTNFEAASLRQLLAIVDEAEGKDEGDVEERPC